MNIALLIEKLDGGGAERVVQRLALGLAQRGHRIFVYCLHAATAALVERMHAGGVVLREMRSFGRDPLVAWRLALWLRRDRVEVAHAHSCAALAWVFPAAKLLGIPVLHVWHGWPPARPTRYHRLALQLTRFVEVVGVNSEWLRGRLPPGRVANTAVHLPNGIDLQPRAPEQAQQSLERLCRRVLHRPIVLTVGNFRAEKDTCGLLQAFALVRHECPQAELVCVGEAVDAAYWQTVQHTRAALKLDGSVHFPGSCPDAWQLMAAADVFCLSSLSESMPNVVLEAMSQRVPVVATTVGDVGRLEPGAAPARPLLRHEETGLLAPPGDPPALAASLVSTLRGPTAARARADRAYADYQQHFRTAQMVQRYEQVYQQCAARRKHWNQHTRAGAP